MHFKSSRKGQKRAQQFQPGTLTYSGCQLFQHFQHCHIDGQHRSKDKDHTAFVQKLSNGGKIETDDILNISPLSKEDASEPDWKWAPILVSTNAERLSLARQKARLWAIEHETYVFKWKCNAKGWTNHPGPDAMESIFEDYAFFWQIWVPMANFYLNANLNADIALVNGSPLQSHSLTFEKDGDYEKLIKDLKKTSLPYGSEIEIDEPLAVNVAIIEQLDNKEISKKRNQQLDVLREISNKYNIDPQSSR